MKKIALIFFFGLSITNIFSQNFYLSKEILANPSLLDKEIPKIAKSILNNYTEKDKETYYINKRALEILSGQYQDAFVSIDSLRNILGKEYPDEAMLISSQYELYLRGLTSKTSFEDAYRTAFKVLYDPLTEFAKLRFPGRFHVNIGEREEEIQEILDKQKNKDSIDQNTMLKLSSLYLSKKVAEKSKSLAISLIDEEDQKRFYINDSIAISTKNGGNIALKMAKRINVSEPMPTILIFDIYPGKSGFRYDHLVKEAAYYGYVGVVASTRGKRFSSNEIEPFEHDANDAYNIIDWISKQPWSNGQVGMMGGSYLGFSQWAATKKMHPALKTIVPQVAVGIGIDYPMHNNVFMSYMLRWINYVTNDKFNDDKDFRDGEKWSKVYNEWYRTGKSFRALDSIEGSPDKIFQRWLDHPDYDKYWQDMATSEDDFAKINIPILTTTGYFDADQRGAMHYMKEHIKRNKNAEHYFIIGPYHHGGGQGRSSKKIGEYVIDSIAKNDMDVIAYQWFDYILKGKEKPKRLKDKINYQVMGANIWKHKPSLKSMNGDTLTYYFDNVRIGKDYKLVQSKTDSNEYIRQEVDFLFRGDSIVKQNSTYAKELNVRNQLSFQTEPFERDFDINGSFIADINAEINKKDMDITLELYELMSDGRYFKLSDFIGRASYAKDKRKRQLLVPGKKESMPVRNSFFVSKRIKKGSKLIVLLGINKNPNWQINYGTGKNVSDETIEDGKTPLQIKWFSDSTIKIPISKVDK